MFFFLQNLVFLFVVFFFTNKFQINFSSINTNKQHNDNKHNDDKHNSNNEHNDNISMMSTQVFLEFVLVDYSLTNCFYDCSIFTKCWQFRSTFMFRPVTLNYIIWKKISSNTTVTHFLLGIRYWDSQYAFKVVWTWWRKIANDVNQNFLYSLIFSCWRKF